MVQDKVGDAELVAEAIEAAKQRQRLHRDEFLQHQRRLRQRVSFAQFWWYGSLSVRFGIRDKRVGLEKETA